MLATELEKHVGKIVAFDLINQQRPVGKIVSVNRADGSATVVIDHPILFVPRPHPTEAGKVDIANVPYGAPLFESDKIEIEASHIVSLLKVIPNMEAAWQTITSGIVVPPKPSLIVP